MAGTRAHALFHVIIQAWTVLSTVSRKVPITRTYLIQFTYQFYDIFYSATTGIWTKITVLVFFHSSGEQYPWISLLNSHLNKRVTLVIFQHGIVFRSMFLDQIAFKDQGLQFRICNDIFKSGYVGDHLLNLGTFVTATLKILPHTVFKADRFSYINDLIPFIVHQIDTRFRGKFF